MSVRRHNLWTQALSSAGPSRRNSLANQVALAAASNQQAAKLASEMEATKLAQAIMGLIKKGIKPSEQVSEAAITTLSQSNNKSAVVQKVLDILAQSLKGPPVKKNNSTCPPDSIGDAYFSGRKVGCVFGTITNPIFKLKLNGTNQTSWKGWKLMQSKSSSSRFDFVKEEYTGGNKNVPVNTLAQKYLDKNLANSIVAIIKGKVHPKTVNDILTKSPQNKITSAVEAVGAAAAAGHTPTKINAVVQDSSSRNLVNKLVALITTPITTEPLNPANTTAKPANKQSNTTEPLKPANTTGPLKQAEGRAGLGGFFSKLFGGRLKFPVLGSFVLDPSSYLPQFINGVAVQYSSAKGYFIDVRGKIVRVFHRGNKLVSQEGEVAEPASANQNAKNKIAQLLQALSELSEATKKAAADYLKAVREAQSASNANKANKAAAAAKARREAVEAEKKAIAAFAELTALYKTLFKVNGTQSNVNINSNEVFNELYSTRFSKMSSTARTRKLAELLKKYPPGSKARDIVKTRTLEEIRNAGQNRNAAVAQRRLQNLRTNIRPALSLLYNRNLTRALGVEGNRAVQNLRVNNRTPRSEYGRRGNEYGRRGNEYGRRGKYGNEYGRRGMYRNEGRRSYGNEYGRREMYGNEGRRYNGNEGVRRRRPEGPSEYSNAAAAALPMNQKNAITNAGGVRTAMNTVASVPGGATEVAKAAEALNETNGNATKAVNIKGASPTAVQAVQKLGGPNNAVYVLHGLNTLSQKPSTIRRKAAAPASQKRRKPLKIRVAELNRVINAVKKQKLISLVAHNVTKTHNIHPNDEKKKKYYRKIIKANILRTKFAKIVKKAAKK